MKKLLSKFKTNRRGAIASIITLVGGSVFSLKGNSVDVVENLILDDICDIQDDASFEEQLPLRNDELLRFNIESNLNLSELVPTIPSPQPPSTVNHLGWPVATQLENGRIVMVYRRQFSHSNGDSIFAGRYVTHSDDLITWHPPYPWPNMAGRIGQSHGNHAIGTLNFNGIERLIIITTDKEFFYSDDQGENWTFIETAFDGMLDGAVEIGPNLINHPEFGLLGVFGQETGINSQKRNYIVRTIDGGNNWEERIWENSKIARSVEPAIATWGDGHMIMIAREYYEPFANPDGRFYHYTQHVYKHENCSFEEISFSTARTNIRGNGILGQSCHDTAEVIYNPVTNRIEVIQSHRLGGGLGNTGNSAWVGSENINSNYFEDNNVALSSDQEPIYTLNIWSISPEKLLEGIADWRFDGTLLSSKGYSVNSCRDGLHPGGSIVDTVNNKHHIFIYSGVRTGPTSIYRISRTLNTDVWRGVSSQEPLDLDCMMLNNSEVENINSKITIKVFPNPANEFIEIEFKISEHIKSEIKIDVFDISGKHIQSLINGYFPIGNHKTIWNINNVIPSGIYAIALRIGSEVKTIKIEVTR